jgi:hypothetical protein
MISKCLLLAFVVHVVALAVVNFNIFVPFLFFVGPLLFVDQETSYLASPGSARSPLSVVRAISRYSFWALCVVYLVLTTSLFRETHVASSVSFGMWNTTRVG